MILCLLLIGRYSPGFEIFLKHFIMLPEHVRVEKLSIVCYLLWIIYLENYEKSTEIFYNDKLILVFIDAS